MTRKKDRKTRHRGIVLDGKRVAQYRHAMGLSQEALAAKIGAGDPKTVQRIEAGEPTTFLPKLAEALGVHPLQLIPDSPNSVNPPPSAQAVERMRLSFFLDVPTDMVPIFKREPLAAKLWFWCQMQGLIRDGAPNITLEFSSIIISADLTRADVLRMTKAFVAGDLSYLGVTNISCTSGKSRVTGGGESQTVDTASQESNTYEMAERESSQPESVIDIHTSIDQSYDWLSNCITRHISPLIRIDDKNLIELLRRIDQIMKSAINQICDEPIPLYYSDFHRISLSVDVRQQTFIFSFPDTLPSRVRNLLEEKQYEPSEKGRIWKKVIHNEAVAKPHIMIMHRDFITDEFHLYVTICQMLQGDPVAEIAP